jgi:predicted enzyme related to lactoylglutathione lyase
MYKIGGNFLAALGVSDWERAKKFYGETLGLKQIFAVEEMGWAEYSTGVENAAIGIGKARGEVKPGGTCPVLGVDNIEAAKADLEQKGVKFEGDIQVIPDMVKLATFHDPDGNVLMLAQSLTTS